VLVLPSEAEMGTDLNRDGDTLDQVLHAVDLVTGATIDLGLAGLPSFAFDPTRPDHAVAFVGEASQGSQDLNGDGDGSDVVSFDLDLAAGSARSSGLAHSTSLGSVLVDGQWAALNVSESAQGAGDLNGDGVLGNALFA
jgi:hypothetical protein